MHRDQGERGERRRWLGLCVGVAVAETVLLGVLAARFSINADEGFYLRAAQELLAGRRLYADFFFPQMPYLPLVEAAVMGLAGPSLFVGRAISVITGGLVAGLIAASAARLAGVEQARVGLAVAIAYAAHTLLLGSLTIVKTYGVANLALVSAVLLVASPRATPARALGAGLCAGVAVGTRLPTAAAGAVLFAWSVWRGRKHGVAFVAGAVLASVPWLWIAAQDPQAFWFGNFGFHALRREISGFGPIVGQKIAVLTKWLLWPQNLVLWVLAAAGTWLQPRRVLVVAACIAALGAVYLAATPTYLEYVTQLVPLLLLAGVPALPRLLRRRGLVVGAAAVYLLGFVVAQRVNWDIGTAPAGSVRAAKLWLWHQGVVSPVAAYLREHSEPEDRILSWWEGYPFLARREGFTGVGFWESNAADKLSAAACRRYQLMHRDDIAQLVATRQPRLIVFPDDVWKGLAGVIAEHYRLAARFWSIQVFERRPDSLPVG